MTFSIAKFTKIKRRNINRLYCGQTLLPTLILIEINSKGLTRKRKSY